MMQMASLNLEQEFGKKVNRTYPPHPLKQFFYERQIPHASLGKVLGISKQSVFLYLDRQYPFPEKYEKALLALADRVFIWERRHGVKFNTYEPIDNNPVRSITEPINTNLVRKRIVKK